MGSFTWIVLQEKPLPKPIGKINRCGVRIHLHEPSHQLMGWQLEAVHECRAFSDLHVAGTER